MGWNKWKKHDSFAKNDCMPCHWQCDSYEWSNSDTIGLKTDRQKDCLVIKQLTNLKWEMSRKSNV